MSVEQLNSKTISPEQMLEANEVAGILNVSSPLVYRLIRQGKLRAVRIGHSVRIRASDLSLFITINTTGGMISGESTAAPSLSQDVAHE